MTPKIDNSREEAAAREVGATAISRRLQKFVVGAFLFTLLSVPLAQIVVEISAGEWPRCFQIVRAIPNVAKVIGEHMNDYKIVVNKSTVPVGTADLVKKIIKEKLFFFEHFRSLLTNQNKLKIL